MQAKAPNKNEIRTRETRELLLRAAETIFVRDGYEGTELGAVASLAGRTKGAIYAQFKSKEDIFLTLVEEHVLGYRSQMQKVLAQSTSIEDNIADLRRFYVRRVEDHAWSILILEYRLFALRHPESNAEFRRRISGLMFLDEKRYAEILGPARKGRGSISRVEAIKYMQPLLSGLVLEAELDGSASENEVIKKITRSVFDALLQIV